MKEKYLTSSILMIRPSNFGYNPETALTNSFQNKPENDQEINGIQEKVSIEFNQMVALLHQNEIDVLIFDDEQEALTPDAIFPNNWFSTHSKTIITYPMLTLNRRRERRFDIIESLIKVYGYSNHIALEHFEEQEKSKILEGTGSLVLDRFNKIAYAAISERTSKELVHLWCEKMNYTPVIFEAYGSQKELIYHTNVMMCVGKTFVVICMDSIASNDQEIVRKSFSNTQKEIIEIDLAQTYQNFAGNMLQLINKKRQTVLVMSQLAFDSLDETQMSLLQKHNDLLLPISIPTIELYGGGSVRCMIAELF